jgi:hypothetical protein
MRLDIQIEAARIARTINSTPRVRVVALVDGHPATYSIDTPSAGKLLRNRPQLVVGTYSPGVCPEQIADDLAVML